MSEERAAQRTDNLPIATSSFVGRQHELAEIKSHMGASRLLTLTGVGGVGKTRLALHAAATIRRAFPDGVWLADLATLEHGDGLADLVAASLRIKERSARPVQEQLVDHVAGRSLLIVMDNCEHLIGATATLVDCLLRQAPGLRVLATSRQALGIAGERVLTVPPLRIPDPAHMPSVETMAKYDAVALLIERAAAVQPAFALHSGNREATARLCAQLDGLPLAIELAATRLRSLSLQQVADRLDNRFRLLTCGSPAALSRQQTLRALIDRSYELCSEQERVLWARLSVFPGDFDLEAVEGICSDQGLEHEVIVDVLDGLVAKSIVTARPEYPQARYRLLETIRQYGRELLTLEGQEQALRRRHRDYYTGVAVTACEAWCGPTQAADLARLRLERDNLSAALDWSAAEPGEAEAGLVLASALRYHWAVGGFLSAGRNRLDQALDLTTDPTTNRGTALWVAAWIALLQGDQDAASKRLDECESVATALGDDHLLAYALVLRGTAAFFRAQLDEALRLFDLSIRNMHRAGDTQGIIVGLFQTGLALTHCGDHAQAVAACEEAIRISESKGEAWGRAQAMWVMGFDHWLRGDPQRAAADLLNDAMTLTPEVDGPLHAWGMELVACIAASAERFTEAAGLLGRAASLWRTMGTTARTFDSQTARRFLQCRTATEQALGREAFQQAFNEGWANPTLPSSLPRHQPGRPVADAARTARVTTRELQVARLIVKGMTNKEIAASLVLSPRTIDGHVERLLAKIGAKTRTQIAVWAAEHDTGRQ
jgi:predicted ATPase/DNA-binding CsgD family transcriptional regulator